MKRKSRQICGELLLDEPDLADLANIQTRLQPQYGLVQSVFGGAAEKFDARQSGIDSMLQAAGNALIHFMFGPALSSESIAMVTLCGCRL